VAPPQIEERRVVAWIGQSVVFKGDLISSEDMRIEGRVEGTIEVRDHDLILGPKADIRGDVVAKTVTIRGAVTGSVTAGEKIEVTESAHVNGDLTSPRLAIVEGATVQGRVHTTTKQAEDGATATPRLVRAK
jgi:cytoskeletal protein CcmA (bactofilin family)